MPSLFHYTARCHAYAELLRHEEGYVFERRHFHSRHTPMRRFARARAGFSPRDGDIIFACTPLCRLMPSRFSRFRHALLMSIRHFSIFTPMSHDEAAPVSIAPPLRWRHYLSYHVRLFLIFCCCLFEPACAAFALFATPAMHAAQRRAPAEMMVPLSRSPFACFFCAFFFFFSRRERYLSLLLLRRFKYVEFYCRLQPPLSASHLFI